MWETKGRYTSPCSGLLLVWDDLECPPRCSGHSSRKNILNFGVQKRLRAFLNPIFTRVVVEENGICSALALSVTFGASSPKGRAKCTSGQFLVSPKALATSVTAWLSLRESWRGSA